jgi:hypothetical protein
MTEVDNLDRLVRIVRSDAEARKQLAVRAAFVSALAQTTPEVVRRPNATIAWTQEKLEALAQATTARLRSREAYHCVVGVADFSVNVSYKKKSLVYLRADAAPPLRVLTYASVSPPAVALTEGTTIATDSSGNSRDVDWNSDASIRRATAVARSALDDRLAPDARSAAEEAKKRESDDASEESRAEVRASRLRRGLTRAFPGSHWHVVHDRASKPFGVSPAPSSGAKIEVRKENTDYVAWRHCENVPGTLETLGLVAGDEATARTARRAFLFVVAACALWYNQMCEVDGSPKTGGGVPTTRTEKTDAVLASLENPLTERLCRYAPKMAPVALIVLTMMGGNYAMGLARRVAARASGRRVKSKKA